MASLAAICMGFISPFRLPLCKATGTLASCVQQSAFYCMHDLTCMATLARVRSNREVLFGGLQSLDWTGGLINANLFPCINSNRGIYKCKKTVTFQGLFCEVCSWMRHIIVLIFIGTCVLNHVSTARVPAQIHSYM